MVNSLTLVFTTITSTFLGEKLTLSKFYLFMLDFKVVCYLTRFCNQLFNKFVLLNLSLNQKQILMKTRSNRKF